MTPEAALLRVIHCLDRAHETGFKTKAFVRALDVVRSTPPDELERRVHDETLTEMEGIGTSTARVITDAILDQPSEYLAKIEAESVVQISDAGRVYLDALRFEWPSFNVFACTSDTPAPPSMAAPSMVAVATAKAPKYLI